MLTNKIWILLHDVALCVCVICKYSIYWIVVVLVLFTDGLMLVIPLKHIALLEALKKMTGIIITNNY